MPHAVYSIKCVESDWLQVGVLRLPLPSPSTVHQLHVDSHNSQAGNVVASNLCHTILSTRSLASVCSSASVGVGKLTGLSEAALSQLRATLSSATVRDHQLRVLAQNVAKRLPSN